MVAYYQYNKHETKKKTRKKRITEKKHKIAEKKYQTSDDTKRHVDTGVLLLQAYRLRLVRVLEMFRELLKRYSKLIYWRLF